MKDIIVETLTVIFFVLVLGTITYVACLFSNVDWDMVWANQANVDIVFMCELILAEMFSAKWEKNKIDTINTNMLILIVNEIVVNKFKDTNETNEFSIDLIKHEIEHTALVTKYGKGFLLGDK